MGQASSDDAAGSGRILVVEDAAEFRALIVPLLQNEGFVVETAPDGEAGVEAARMFDPALIVLDLAMPKLDGIEACRQIRKFSDAYIVMLTGKADEVDMLIGLSVGADDYMTKPFSPRELVARIRAMMRRPRATGEAPAVRAFGELRIDPVAREVFRGEERIELTRIEFDLLDVLSSNPRMAFNRSMLLERVWGPDWYGDDHVVDVHMSNLRKKIGADPASPQYIRTVRGVGYRMGEGV